jgi:two-component system nitrogen regulation response regulator GlnG
MTNYKVLVCEDDPKIQILTEQLLSKVGNFDTTITKNAKELINEYSDKYDVILLDIRLPESSGLELLKEIKGINSNAIVIMMTAYSTENLVIECMRAGAYNYIKKPFNIDYLVSTIKEACESNTKKANGVQKSTNDYSLDQKIIKSAIIKEIEKKLNKLASKKLSILLTGESGTGKEYYAKLLAKERKHINERFVDINCPAIPENLFESELYGHVKGSFTGAIEDKKGKFELANNGTLFLDEIADLNLSGQSKLLRVLQEREVIPVGGTKNIPVNFQLISATSKDLKQLMIDQEFRPDLFYRICDIEIQIPPLREHLEDINELVCLIANEYSKNNNEKVRTFTEEAIERLKSYDWPGNIRELKSAIRRVLILNDVNIIDEDIINEDLLKHFISSRVEYKSESKETKERTTSQKHKSLDIQDAERSLIAEALENCEYNLTQTAKELGFGRSTLYRKIKKYNIKT